MAPITGFDTTGFPVTFAAEVKNFDPLNFVDKKEARKMGRFIHFAFAATQEAMEQSGLKITPENAERVGVFIGSGIGGGWYFRSEPYKPLRRRAPPHFPFLFFSIFQATTRRPKNTFSLAP